MNNTYSFYTLLKDHRVIIPLIQRDYAQGRQNKWVNDIRDKFLASLYDAVTLLEDKKPLVLDFIYGELEDEKFHPFDGQQRLTTLFLLHSYAAVKAKMSGEAAKGAIAPDPAVLANFKYFVRESSRLFLSHFIHEFILKPTANFGGNWSKTIRNQPWYILQWDLDPTIAGMLTMLDAIDEKFHDCEGLWQTLTQDQNKAPIVFYYTPLTNLSLSADEIYVKMNARGKQLTEFENFKASLLGHLKSNASDKVDDIAKKLDGDWSLLFWNLTKASSNDDKTKDRAELSDKAFMRFIRYFIKITYYLGQNSGALNKKNSKSQNDISEKEDFSKRIANVNRAFLDVIGEKCNATSLHIIEGIECLKGVSTHLDLFETILDTLAKIPIAANAKHFRHCFYIANTNRLTPPSKTRIALFTAIGDGDDKNSVHFLKALIAKDNGLSLASEIMLFACLLAFIKHKESHENPLQIERKNLRILRNLLVNSPYEMRVENFGALISETATLMLTGTFEQAEAFSKFQKDEESRKLNYRQQWQDDANAIANLNRLENHIFLQGSIGIFEDDKSQKQTEQDLPPYQTLKERLSQGRRLFCALTLETPSHNQVPLSLFMQAMLTEQDYYYELSKGNPYHFRCGYGKVYNISDAYPSFTQIFVPKDQDSRGKCQTALLALCVLIKDKTNIAKEFETQILAWLKSCEEAKAFCWRYYLVKYPKMLSDPEFSHYGIFSTTRGRFSSEIFKRQNRTDGSYQNSLLRQLFHTMNETRWKDDADKNLFQDDAIYENGLTLSNGLILKSGEFGWQLISKNEKEPDKAKHLQKIADMNKKLAESNATLPQIDQNGHIAIAGLEKTRPKDQNQQLKSKHDMASDAFNDTDVSISDKYNEVELYRDYDHYDRILLMQNILTKWFDLETKPLASDQKF
ncbi:DUF262 domain-containing protein (plasmid) [Bartonella sp. HY329]|uniref:DUF262 domain-containing protein n=1 Tax=unclassified Bartonella TaxID=2645622 RepID=UPI0021CAC401|nr:MULTISPECIES: DUF262 domain-containing protein [unclassified Bartonella]UXM96565.1 DUF262 domain-containing protein [Bartonella sp. HY329]UXN10888.1 DUF262 domain-containing protein [Bartonella sp. HY328]